MACLSEEHQHNLNQSTVRFAHTIQNTEAPLGSWVTISSEMEDIKKGCSYLWALASLCILNEHINCRYFCGSTVTFSNQHWALKNEIAMQGEYPWKISPTIVLPVLSPLASDKYSLYISSPAKFSYNTQLLLCSQVSRNRDLRFLKILIPPKAASIISYTPS